MSAKYLREIPRIALVIAFGYALGQLASWVKLPLPWLIAPLLGAAALSLARLPVGLPVTLRKLGQLGVAVVIGMTFSASVMLLLFQSLPLILASAFVAILVGSGVAIYLSRKKGLELATSFFLCMPGGVAEMSVMAEKHGGDTALVAMGQSLRVILIVLTTPFAVIALANMDKSAAVFVEEVRAFDFLWLPLLITIIAALALGWAFDRLKVMNAWFLAGLAVGLAAVLGPWEPSYIPPFIPHLSQVLIGLALGARITPNTVGKMRHLLPLCICSTLLLMMVGFALVPILHWISGIDMPSLILATSPGGVAEMSITARDLHLVAPLVTAYHLVRILLVVFLNQPLYRLARKF